MKTSIALSGKLSFVSLADLLQLLAGIGSSGILHVQGRTSPHPGLVYFSRGNPVDATVGDLSGLDGLYGLFGWAEGEFQFDQQEVERPREIHLSWTEIILNSLRMRDNGSLPTISAAGDESEAIPQSEDQVDQVLSLLKEGEVYWQQGLFADARKKYREAYLEIRRKPELRSRKHLVEKLKEKLTSLNADVQRLQRQASPQEMSSDIQELIRSRFSFSADPDAAALEGAVALAKFGQFERALSEFEEILRRGAHPLEAGKNILRCHLASRSMEEAVKQYRDWIDHGPFSADQMGELRAFLQDILRKKGVDLILPAAVNRPAAPEPPRGLRREDELMDISAVSIPIESGPEKGRTVDLEVGFQRADMISLFIPRSETELISYLSPGVKLSEVQFYSTFAVFTGTGIVSSMARINAGPLEGDYNMDMKVVLP